MKYLLVLAVCYALLSGGTRIAPSTPPPAVVAADVEMDDYIRRFHELIGEDDTVDPQPTPVPPVPSTDLQKLAQRVAALEEEVRNLKSTGSVGAVEEPQESVMVTMESFIEGYTGRALKGYNGIAAKEDLVRYRKFPVDVVHPLTETQCMKLLGAFIDGKLPEHLMP